MKKALVILLSMVCLSLTAQVPSQCTDVMLQGFYFGSYNDNGYGDTRWVTLVRDTADICRDFDLVWLPPSASSSEDNGYHPAQYSNQNSNRFGSRTLLTQLISALHKRNTKVIADIVINHAGNKSSWCDFHQQNFGTYGTFNPNSAWITASDEVWTKGPASCVKSAEANADDGYGSEANYDSARDWDHKNPNVNEMFKAYLQWMKSVMQYDGWRYDYCKGFHTSHINDYNQASSPYLSVMEYWDGSATILKARLQEAEYNTMTFDFPGKFTIFNNGIAKNLYNNCRVNGMRGLKLTKYAVTFIDNHDTFARNNGSEFCGNNSITTNPNRILQANAYLLSMPGLPCVFYPHWVTFKNEISTMIKARKLVGIHSESTVLSEESGNAFYRATIEGLYGTLILKLGANSGFDETPEGYTCAISGTNYGIFYKRTDDAVTKLTQLDGVYSQGSELHIDGHEGQQCNIFNISGQLVGSALIDNYSYSVMLPQGLYIVRIGNQTAKIAITQ